MVSNFLFVILVFYIFIYSIRHFIKKRYFLVNFESLFTLGFIYYLIVPYFFFVFKKDQTVIKMFNGVYNYVKQISELNLCLYIVSIFLLYFSAMHFSKYHLIKNTNIKEKKLKTSFVINYKFVYFLLLSLCVFYTYKFKNFLGRGYLDESNMTGDKGTFISFTLLLYIVSFFLVSPKKKVFTIYTFIYFIFALIIMTMGGRLYFLTTLISVFVFFCNYKIRIRIKYLVFSIFILALLFSIIGVVRQGNKISIELILFIFLGEPILTSYSLFSCLSMNTLPVLKFPYEFLFGCINLIPSFILPDKISILNSFANMTKVDFVSPVGAESIFTSLIVNFGIFGIPLFMWFLSLVLRYIGKINQNLYFFAISWFVFTFFRDPLYVSMWKILFEFVYLFPVLLMINNQFIYIAVGKNENTLR